MEGQEETPAALPQEPSTPSQLRLTIPRQRAWKSLQLRALAIATTVLALLATVFISPVLLLVVRNIFVADWETLSAVGQSYTGISTLFSVAALMGAVLTIRLQIRQSQVAQEHALRDTQFQLLALALQDEHLMQVLPVALPDDADYQSKRQHVFLTMGLRHLQFLYLTKDLPEAALEDMLRSEYFNNERARRHWLRVRKHWAAGIDSARERTFVATAERVWQSMDQRP
jgi:hypothetical protein